MKYYIEKIDKYILLKKELKKEYNIDKYELIKNKYNKPFLKNSNIYFNLSSFNNVSIIAMSNKEIGVDIEKISYNKAIVNRCFCQNEKKLLNKNNKDEMFTTIWTKKEAYLKCIGTGIIGDLKKIDTTKINTNTFKYEDYIISIYQR